MTKYNAGCLVQFSVDWQLSQQTGGFWTQSGLPVGIHINPYPNHMYAPKRGHDLNPGNEPDNGENSDNAAKGSNCKTAGSR